jgi:uroporphyrinogen-III synthase
VETQEGLIEELKKVTWDKAYFLWPRSSLSRSVLLHFFREREIRYRAFDLYDTFFQKPEPVPDLKEVDEIVFTSPSTVRAFVHIFGKIPKDKKLCAQGPITETVLLDLVNGPTLL